MCWRGLPPGRTTHRPGNFIHSLILRSIFTSLSLEQLTIDFDKMHSHLHTPYNISMFTLEPGFDDVPATLTIHSIDCEEIMTALDECHARGFLYKALGNCNDIKRDVNKCLSSERYDRAKRNRDEARSNRRRIEGLWSQERALDQPSTTAVESTASEKK